MEGECSERSVVVDAGRWGLGEDPEVEPLDAAMRASFTGASPSTLSAFTVSNSIATSPARSRQMRVSSL